MRGYIKTAEFARLCKTTKNTLIHYDQMGVLKPAALGANGYRYYALNDQYRFFAIRALVDAGFSLSEVAEVFSEYNPQAFGERIAAHREGLREHIARLEMASRLLDEMERQLDQDKELELGVFRLEEWGVRRTLPLKVKADSLWLSGAEAEAAESEVAQTLAAISPEATLARFGLKAYGGAEENVRYDGAFYLLPDDIAVPAGVEVEEIPAGAYAQIAGSGSVADAARVHKKLLACLEERGLTPVGPRYEIIPLRLLDIALQGEYRFVVSVRCV